jgi:hypothetical protein
MPEICHGAEISHLVDHDVGLGRAHCACQGSRIGTIGDRRLACPALLIAFALATLRVKPVTAWPFTINAGTSPRRTAPVAPATKIRMLRPNTAATIGTELGRSEIQAHKKGDHDPQPPFLGVVRRLV